MCSLLTAAPSAPPTNFAVAVTGTTMAFSWSPPGVMQQNGEIISYTLTCMQTAGNPVTATTTDLQFTIDTYIPGATFQCSVLATNAIGDGPSAELTLNTESKALLIDVLNSVSITTPLAQMPFLALKHICLYLS